MRHQPLLRLTLATCTVAIVAFTAVPLPLAPGFDVPSAPRAAWASVMRDPSDRALRDLARRAPADAVPVVAEALRSEDARRRFLALDAALVAPDPAYVPALRPLAASEDRVERRLANASLVALGEPGAEDALVAAAADARRDGDPWVELLSAEALARAGATSGARLWSDALGRIDPHERGVAVGRIAATCPPVLEPALRALADDPSPGVRAAALACAAGR